MKLHDICHVEIRTRDLAKAKAFYGGVFDWKLADWMPGYAGIDTGAVPGGGLFQTPTPEMPLGVCNYVWVEDCEATGRRATELGGRLIVPKTEIPQVGWFAITLDKWGNELGLFQEATRQEPKPQGSGKNGFCWVELAAPNLDQSVGYYSKLFGWKFTSDPKVQYAHTEHTGEQIGVGLMGGENAKQMKGVLTYINAEDLAATGKKIASAGGRVLFGPQTIPEVGSFSVFADPEGNTLAIFKSARTEK